MVKHALRRCGNLKRTWQWTLLTLRWIIQRVSAGRTFHGVHSDKRSTNMIWSLKIKTHFYLHWNVYVPYTELENLPMILVCWCDMLEWDGVRVRSWNWFCARIGFHCGARPVICLLSAGCEGRIAALLDTISPSRKGDIRSQHGKMEMVTSHGCHITNCLQFMFGLTNVTIYWLFL